MQIVAKVCEECLANNRAGLCREPRLIAWLHDAGNADSNARDAGLK